jgi:extracellular factor (EF) 3-hydroxypalmitic acid methyl ester biosynthesis protein
MEAMIQNAPVTPAETPVSSIGARRLGSRRLRPHRVRVGELGLVEITAVAHHPTAGLLNGTVADLSIHGLGLLVTDTSQLGSLVLAGDRLPSVIVSAGDRVIHEGAAVVRRVSEQPGHLSVGLELEAPGLDLSEVYRQGARKGLAQRWARVHQVARYADISPDFKAWVASLRAYLGSVQAFLDREEGLLSAEDQTTRRSLEAELLDLVAPDVAGEMSSATERLAILVKDLSDEEHAVYRAFCLLHLGAFFRCSPFMRRAHEKPLGYAGDYEMMNMLYRDPAEGQTLFGKVLNLYATREAAAQANINRLDFIARKIERAAEAAGGGRVLGMVVLRSI